MREAIFAFVGVLDNQTHLRVSLILEKRIYSMALHPGREQGHNMSCGLFRLIGQQGIIRTDHKQAILKDRSPIRSSIDHHLGLDVRVIKETDALDGISSR